MTSKKSGIILTPLAMKSFLDESTGENKLYLVYWLEPNLEEKANQEVVEQLVEIIPLAQTFDDLNKCRAAIVGQTSVSIVLIVSNALAETFIPEIHNLPQITKIFIYCTCDLKIDTRSIIRRFSKVKEVIYDSGALIGNVANDWLEKDKPGDPYDFCLDNPFDLCERTIVVDKTTIKFLKMYIKCITRLGRSINSSKNDLIEILKKYNIKNDVQLEKIKEFERIYSARDAIKWYTKDFCIYRVMNKVLRKGDPECLYSVRRFTQDLYEQLKMLFEYQRQIVAITNPVIRVYRAQAMSKLELMKLSHAGVFSLKTFLSITLDRECALGFAAGGAKNKQFHTVVFEIHADTRLNTMPFADISTISQIPEEREVLFMPGAMFRVKEAVCLNNSDDNLVKLELLSEDYYGAVEMPRFYEDEVLRRKKTSEIDFANVILYAGQPEKAERVALRALNYLTSNDDRIIAYGILGNITESMTKYDRTVLYREKALQLILVDNQKSDLIAAHACRGLSQGYMYQKRYDLTIEFAEYAIDLASPAEGQCIYVIVHAFNNLGVVYREQGKFDLSLYFLEKSLQYRKIIYPPDHESLGIACQNLANVWINKGDLNKGMNYLEESFSIYRKSLPFTHPSTGDVCMTMGEVLLASGKIREAVMKFGEALAIYEHSLPSTHPNRVRARLHVETYMNTYAAAAGIPPQQLIMPFI
ncbi:unnamed protein product [Rotaria magnacalcarata]|uniref:NAD(+)--protein-arginine ADP-ribosyltransferase n=1 Tax=Rotaria magnacalcarata TaxID=392030 RepID=A0A816QZS8_9BILA|nr:unnamed protein product [Rotaria magnacalcarata]CAF2240046.1 unnamed protein product [Rotaria magnacalcarata]